MFARLKTSKVFWLMVSALVAIGTAVTTDKLSMQEATAAGAAALWAIFNRDAQAKNGKV